MSRNASESLFLAAQVTPQTVNAAANAVSGGVDVGAADEVFCAMQVGVVTGGVTAITLSIEDCDTVGGTYAAVTTVTASGSPATPASTKHYVAACKTRNLRQFARVKVAVTGGTSAIVSAALVLEIGRASCRERVYVLV